MKKIIMILCVLALMAGMCCMGAFAQTNESKYFVFDGDMNGQYVTTGGWSGIATSRIDICGLFTDQANAEGIHEITILAVSWCDFNSTYQSVEFIDVTRAADALQSGSLIYSHERYSNGGPETYELIGILLPDDCSIAGNQWIKFSVGDEVITVNVEMTYIGSPDWMWSVDETSHVIEVNSGAKYFKADETYSGGVYATSSSWADSENCTIDIWGYFTEEANRQGFTEFENIEVSWCDFSRTYREVQGITNEGAEQFVINNIMVYSHEFGTVSGDPQRFDELCILLPDDPSIAGAQWIRFTVGDETYTINVQLDYRLSNDSMWCVTELSHDVQ